MKHRLPLVMLVLALFSVFAFAQTETGTITGTVTDPSGAVVSGATVTAKNTGTGAVRTATTGGSGGYTLSSLPPAPYQLTVTAQGFATYKRAMTVAVASTNAVDVRLTVAAAGVVVEVTSGAGAVQVETQSSEVSQEVSPQQMSELPSIDRNPYDLAVTAGNVAGDTANRGVGVAINGQRSSSTDILLDGGENVDLFSASVGQSVPMDSVQEFRVTTSDMSAEYGRASGGVVNVATKSGSNAFHGTAYEYNRVAKMASNTYDNNAYGIPRAPFTRNQFGYSVGGPVVKNKLFFFSSTEWLRVRSTASTLGYVPDPTFISTYTAANTQSYFTTFGQLKSGNNYLASQALTVDDLVTAGAAGPLLTALDSTAPTQNVLDLASYHFPADVGGGPPQNTWNTVARVDYNFSDKTQMFGRYTIYDDKFFVGSVSSSAYQGWDSGETDKNQNLMFSLTHLWTSNFISNTKISLNRLNDVQALGSNGVAPGMYASTSADGPTPLPTVGVSYMLPGYLPYSAGQAIPFGGPQNVLEFDQSASWTHGKHSLKFGGEYVYIRDNRAFGAYETGYEFLSQDGSTSTMMDGLLSGNLTGFTTGIYPQGEYPCERDPITNAYIVTAACTLQGPATSPNFTRSNRYKDAALYAQDTWKVFPRLTLNFGLRWEYYGVQHNKNADMDANLVLGSGNIYNQLTNAQVENGSNLPNGGRLWKPAWHNFGPRIGFAYDVFGDGKTSLRGGYGIAYERNFGNVTYNVIQNPPNYAVLQLIGNYTISNNNFGPAGQAGSYPFPDPTLRAVDTNIKPAYSSVWNLSIEREVARNTVAALEYSGSRGIHGYDIQAANGPGYGPAFTGLGCGPAGGAACENIFQKLNLQYTNINFRGNGNDSWHDALNAKLTSSNLFKQGLNLTANYTWSHTMDYTSATFGQSDEYGAQTLGTMDPFNPKLDFGDADYDVRQRLALSAIWALPYAQHTHGVAKQVLDGWELAPIFSAQTGYPYTLFDCTQNPVFIGPYDYNCARYIPSAPFATKGTISTSAANTVGTNEYLYETVPAPLVYGNAYGNGSLPTCSADPTTGLSLGTNCTYPSNMSGRNAFRQPGTWNMNLAINKMFKVTEKMNLQFRSEFYNIFNHSNYYVQTGQIISNGGLSDVSNLIFGPAGNCVNLSAFGAPNGSIEYYQYDSTTGTCTTTPATYPIVGKKGVYNAAQGSGTGSLGDRRYIQFALKLIF